MILRKTIYPIVILILEMVCLAFTRGITRVSFTRPSYMMKIPISSKEISPYVFRTGLSTEMFDFSDIVVNTEAVYFETDLTASFKLGVTTIQGVAGDSPVEIGLHFQKKFFEYSDVSFSAGLYDFVFQQGSSKMSLDTRSLSLFGVLGNEKEFENYKLNTYIGIGTGGFSKENVRSDSARGNQLGFFAGIMLNTSAMQEKGGIDFIAEYDGTGVNMGIRVPIGSNYKINFGVIHMENLPKFGKSYRWDSPAFVVSLDFIVPRIKEIKTEKPGMQVPQRQSTIKELNAQEYYEQKIDSILKACDIIIAGLRDSIEFYESQIKYLSNEITYLRQKIGVLEDSVRSVKLAKYAMERNTNMALRHLSKSLRYFYEGDYIGALKEVEKAIELNPNLALAYARRGSIYYKLGDIERATLNWNLALRLDPDYEDVRNILKAMSEYRLKSVKGLGKE